MADVVIFRKWKSGEFKGRVCALFPEHKGEVSETCLMYILTEGELQELSINYSSAVCRTVKPHGSSATALRKKLQEEGFKELVIRERAPSEGRGEINRNRSSKRCPVCEREKAREDFPVSKHSRDGMHSTCAACTNIEVACAALARKKKKGMLESRQDAELRIRRIDLLLAGNSPRQVARIEAEGAES